MLFCLLLFSSVSAQIQDENLINHSVDISQPKVDNTVTRIQIFANGTAKWKIEIRTRLDNESEVASYHEFQKQFRNNTDKFLDSFRRRMQRVVTNAENVTNRSMQASNFTATTNIQKVPRRWGIVTYRFLWENFARASQDAIIVGDVFQGGFYLAENDILIINGPQNYTIASVSPIPNTRHNGILRWNGPINFADEKPHIRYVLTESITHEQTPTTTDQNQGTMENGQSRYPSSLSVLLAISGLTIICIAGLGYYITHHPFRIPFKSSDNEPVESEVTNMGTLTDEEKVTELLKEQDRLHQADIAEELGWSSSKTSRVLSRMAEANKINKIQVGRENLISLVDEANDP
ncbi:MAG: helix-turn-helix transcriptional regulator [Halobacteriaceae archaeon]